MKTELKAKGKSVSYFRKYQKCAKVTLGVGLAAVCTYGLVSLAEYNTRLDNERIAKNTIEVVVDEITSIPCNLPQKVRQEFPVEVCGNSETHGKVKLYFNTNDFCYDSMRKNNYDLGCVVYKGKITKHEHTSGLFSGRFKNQALFLTKNIHEGSTIKVIVMDNDLGPLKDHWTVDKLLEYND